MTVTLTLTLTLSLTLTLTLNLALTLTLTQVRVVAAAELIAADRNGSSDPYVVVQLAGGSTSVGSVLAGGIEDVRGALGELQGDIAQAKP